MSVAPWLTLVSEVLLPALSSRRGLDLSSLSGLLDWS